MMILSWIKCKLYGTPPPTKVLIIEKIETENVRLNGALEELEHEVDKAKTTRLQNQDAMTMMLDETLRTVEKKRR